MAINFGLSQVPDYLSELQERGRQQQIALQQQKFLADQQERSRILGSRGQTADLAARGDYVGARQSAAAAGDFEYGDALGKLDDDQRARFKEGAAALGSAAQDVFSRPEQEQAAAWAAHRGILKQYGFDDHELDDIGSHPERLRAAAAAGLTAAQQIEARDRQSRQDLDREKFEYDKGKVTYHAVQAGGHLVPTLSDGTVLDDAGGPTPQGNSGQFDRMITAESAGRQFGRDGRPILSPKGATGIAQLMPSTGPEAARLAGVPWDADRFRNDPAYNRALGEAYYGRQLADFNGDPTAAAAAYNAGPGRASRAGAPRTQGDWQQSLPAETRDYIRKVAPGYAGSGRGGGGPRTIYGPPKETYHVATQSEIAQNGLDPSTRWQVSPQGQFTPLQAKGDKPLTEAQSNAKGFYDRAQLAEQQVAQAGNVVPGAGSVLAYEAPLGLGNRFVGAKEQQTLAAREAFITAVLRKESGAAIGASEFVKYNRQFFPQPGDNAQTQRNKAALRRAEINALRVASGPASPQASRPTARPSDIDSIMAKYGVR